MDHTQKIVHDVIAVGHMHHRSIENAVRGMGLHHSGHRMLVHLAVCKEQPSQKELAAQFHISPAAVANNLKKLEREGYIARSSDEGDTRLNRISITEKGKDILNETRIRFDSVDETMLEGFSAMERDLLLGYLARLKSNLATLCGEETPPFRQEDAE